MQGIKISVVRILISEWLNPVITLLLLFLMAFSSCGDPAKQPAGDEKIKLLILSGCNNHDWETTTPVLLRIYRETGCFEITVTGNPDTLSFKDMEPFDAIVSNWNSWPERDVRWSPEAEEGLLKYIESGGGFVTFHASSSALYDWPDFKKISTGAWIKGTTWHGKRAPAVVTVINRGHPVTRGMAGFFIMDELWVNAELNNDFQVLATATNGSKPFNPEKYDLEAGDQPAVLVSEFGKGRIFHTILGHNARAMRNAGLRALIARGTEWAATAGVHIPLPQELRLAKEKEISGYSWKETDTSYAMLRGNDIVWQFNFNTKYGKPFFHPVYVGGERITCLSPDDHPWHPGQWFSWKFINGKNYWEYIRGTLRSEGVTDVTRTTLTKNPDNSVRILLDIEYHPRGGPTVLNERRIIDVSVPRGDGSMYMDYRFAFQAVADTVLLDRTPIEEEPGGKTWGGYGGLSLRFNQSFYDPGFISPAGETTVVNRKDWDWLYMGFTGLKGGHTGSAIMVPEESKREYAAWYSVVNDELPFYFFTPAYLYFKPLSLTRGEKFILEYRILHIPGEVSAEELQNAYNEYAITE